MGILMLITSMDDISNLRESRSSPKNEHADARNRQKGLSMSDTIHRQVSGVQYHMPKLPENVIRFLLENPSELMRLQQTIKARAKQDDRRAVLTEKKKNAPIGTCGIYGCKNPRNVMDSMCASCMADYKEDPDAFK